MLFLESFSITLKSVSSILTVMGTLSTPFGEYLACTKTINCLSKDIFNTLLLDGQCDIKMRKKDASKN